jgi:hypothetical protein
MSSRSTLIAAILAIALFALGAETVRAQGDVPEVCTIKATITIQNTNSVDFPGPPTVLKFTTKELLALIGKAEYVNDNLISGTNFPSGAKLIQNFGDFTVWDSQNNPLLESDITFVFGYNDLFYPVYTFTATAETDYGVANFYIYDIDAGGGTDLTLIGNAINTIKNSATTSAQALTMKAGGGTGFVNSQDENALMSGSFSAKGSGPF